MVFHSDPKKVAMDAAQSKEASEKGYEVIRFREKGLASIDHCTIFEVKGNYDSLAQFWELMGEVFVICKSPAEFEGLEKKLIFRLE